MSSRAAVRTVTERLADHVVDLRYDDIPSPVIEKTKDMLVYQLGLALSGRVIESGDQAVRVAAELSGAGGTMSIIGERRKADLLEAVFANSLLMSNQGLDDGIPPAGIHPGVLVQPAAWTTAEATAASGRELLTAVVIGYDIVGKVARPVWTWGWERPRTPNNVFGPIGAAAAAARLFGLSREATADALGHAAHSGMGLPEGVEFLFPYQGLLARNGVMAAILAKTGLAMAPKVIEGRYGLFRSFHGEVPDELESSLATLGQEYEISVARTKPYRSSRFNVIPIELLTELTKTHALAPDRTSGIEVTLPVEREHRETAMEDAYARSPNGRTGRAASLRYQLAVIVSDGKHNPARFDGPIDPAIQELVGKIQLRFEPGLPKFYARLDVATTNGGRYVTEGDSYQPPPTNWAEWLGDGGHSVLSDRQLSRLSDLISDLENVTDISEVVDCFVPNSDAT